MSTDTDSRARAETAWNALSDAERREAMAPADGLAASMTSSTWILGHMAGQRQQQQASAEELKTAETERDCLVASVKAVTEKYEASAEEIARLKEQLETMRG